MDTNPLVPILHRPQYAQSPDLFVISLANRAYKVAAFAEPASPNARRVYRDNRSPSSTARALVETAADGQRLSSGERQDRLAKWGAALAKNGLTGDEVAKEVVAAAMARSIGRRSADKAKSDSAVPFSPNTALLQEVKGLVGSTAPDYSVVVEQLFSLGHGGESGPLQSATDLWLEAMSCRLESDLLVRAIDRASASLLPAITLVEGSRVEDAAAGAPELGRLIRDSNATPMHWLCGAWREVTQPHWVERLPARRWVDWASAVLRLGFGMGLMWDANYFSCLATIVLGEEVPTEDDLKAAIDSRGKLLRWPDSYLAVSSRAVRVRPALRRGLLARKWFESEAKNRTASPVEVLVALNADRNARESLARQVGSPTAPPGEKNLFEAVKYALSGRQADGDGSDLYGLMRYRGRYLVVEPGPELIAVGASLVAGEERSATVGDLMGDLELLGIHSSLGEVLAETERSGLAEMSADADIAVTIRSAF